MPTVIARRKPWLDGSPERLALARVEANRGTVDDYLLLAMIEADEAAYALPPFAVAPRANNCGEIIKANPDHANACAARAYGFISKARAMLTGVIGFGSRT
jgi:hypothetical protein